MLRNAICCPWSSEALFLLVDVFGAFGVFGVSLNTVEALEKALEKQRGVDTICQILKHAWTVPFEHTHAPLLLQACPLDTNRQNPHHSLEPNGIQMTREGYGWLFHSCCNDRYPLDVRIHHDSFSTLCYLVSIMAWQIHVRFSVSLSFTHALSISYIIKKRFTKGNVRELDIDRVLCRSLNMM